MGVVMAIMLCCCIKGHHDEYQRRRQCRRTVEDFELHPDLSYRELFGSRYCLFCDMLVAHHKLYRDDKKE